MNVRTPKIPNIHYLTAPATHELERYLRAKKQPGANIIIQNGDHLYTTNPVNWITHCVAKAAGAQPPNPSRLTKFLGTILARVADWTPDDYRVHLRTITIHLTNMLAACDTGNLPVRHALIHALRAVPPQIRVSLDAPTDAQLEFPDTA